MTYSRPNRGVCSSKTTVTLGSDGVIESVEVADGCDGSLKGVCALLRGRNARDAIEALGHITCERKKTSCPQQVALCLQEALEQLER